MRAASKHALMVEELLKHENNYKEIKSASARKKNNTRYPRRFERQNSHPSDPRSASHPCRAAKVGATIRIPRRRRVHPLPSRRHNNSSISARTYLVQLTAGIA